MTLGRTAGFDLFAQNPSGVNMTISVKTTYLKVNKFLLMDKKAEKLIDESLFYAFVRLNMPDDNPEFWIVPASTVATVIKESHEIYMETPKKNGSKHKDTKIREFYLIPKYNFPDDWEEQLKFFKSNVRMLEELR